ncbi:hypothetical protein JS561_01175 [Salmonella enterica subsp. enterica serovar Infantis]|nr:hypothetical protein JS561_01175 [Salmonella enterica subsp. enterica serovar Infantis]
MFIPVTENIITSLFNELKESGIAIIYRDINPTPENTRLAESRANIIVATGFDEGGTLHGTALVPDRTADCGLGEKCSRHGCRQDYR